VQAAVATAFPSPGLSLQELPQPVPGEHEVVLEVEACGICGTDLHILDGASYQPTPPFVLGHEPVGTVVEVGDGVETALIGRRMTITLFVGDGTCGYCQVGDERLCADLVGITGVLGRSGGFADYLVVRQEQLVSIPDGLDSITAAVLIDSGATAANAVRVVGELLARTAAFVRGRPAVVVGAGPIGVLVAELFRAAGRASVVVQPSPTRRLAVQALGHRVVPSLDAVGESPATVVDCAGAPEALEWALDHLVPHGVFVAAGYGPVPGLSLAAAARKELTITGVRSGRREDLVRILDYVDAGLVRAPTVATWPLTAINDAIRALRSHEVAGKAVIIP
jgi:propanol-preferring alcohol dehydrogenase